MVNEKIIKKYRIYCLTDQKSMTIWSETTPTSCPDNNNHSIDDSSITILEKVETGIVSIREETTETGGNFSLDCLDIDIPASTGETEHTFTWPIDISILSVYLLVNTSNIGDVSSVISAHNTVIGLAISDVNISDTTINVSSTVLENIQKGFYCSLFNSSNNETSELNRVLSIDKDNSTITVENPIEKTFLASETILFRMSVYRMKDIALRREGEYQIGTTKIGASFLPANVPVSVFYTNNDGLAKNFTIYVEYLY